MSGALERISIIDTYGAGYIGAIITAALYGLTTLQAYFYYVQYPEDRPGLKLFVSLIWSLDSLHMAVVAYCIYYYLVINYNNPHALAFGDWSFFISVALSVINAFIVRCYFTQQIHALCPKRFKVFVTTLIGLTVVGHLAFGMELVVLGFKKKELARFPEMTLIAVTPFVLMALLSDIFIAVALCTLLWGNRTSVRSTNTIISKLIIYAINRCLLTSLVAIGEVITFVVAPKTLWYLAVHFVIGKLYTNSILATLNSRQAIRDIGHNTVNAINLSQLNFQQSLTNSRGSDIRRDQIEVNLQYETRTDENQIMPGTKMDVSWTSSGPGLASMNKV